MKQHEKRFIIEFNLLGGWQRSGNKGLSGFFATRKEANKALANADPNEMASVPYHVRQK